MKRTGRVGASLTRQIGTILWKDTTLEWRTKARLVPTAFFVLLMLLVFNFSFELGGAALTEIGPGVLWGAFIFASLFGLNQTFASERDNHCLDALLLSSGSPSALYLAKMLGNVLFLLVVEMISMPAFALFFNLSLSPPLILLLPVLVLGSAGLAAVGTLFAAMAQQTRLREFILPMLILPVIVPLVISCVEATTAALEQVRLGLQAGLRAEWWRHLQILAVYTLVFTTLSTMLFGYVVEES